MEPTQKVTITQNETTPQTSSVTDARHAALIDYRAVNGLITDDDGIRKLSVDKFAAMLGVDRRQIYRWQESIPDFWDKVGARRKEIAPKARLNRVHETLYLKAVKGDYQHLQLWLANFDPDFKMPTQKLEHEVGQSLADVLAKVRQNKAVEAEVIDHDADSV